LVLIAFVCGDASSAAEPDRELTLRGPAQIYGLVIPDFPVDSVSPGKPLEIHIRLSVTEGGLVQDASIEPTPEPLKQVIKRTLMKWFVLPDVCQNSKWTSAEVRASMVFSIEEGRQLVTVKNPEWYASGATERYADPSAPTATSTVAFKEPRDIATYPRKAYLSRLNNGIVVGVIKFGPDGSKEILSIYSWPSPIFAEEVRHTLLHWELHPDDANLKAQQAVLVCFKFSFENSH